MPILRPRLIGDFREIVGDKTVSSGLEICELRLIYGFKKM